MAGITQVNTQLNCYASVLSKLRHWKNTSFVCSLSTADRGGAIATNECNCSGHGGDSGNEEGTVIKIERLYENK